MDELEITPMAPYLEQYFGAWCYEPERFQAVLDRVAHLDLAAHVRTQQAAGIGGGGSCYAYDITPGGVAVMDMAGSLMKHASSLMGGTSTVKMRRTMREAAGRDDVRAILLRIDSPGGTAAGTAELADDVRAAAALKPVVAYIEDLGASAAYWVASAASKIVANRTGLVGSIGTFSVVYDLSGRAAQQGIKAVVIKAGEYKATGAPGTEITDKQKAYLQELIDATNSHFTGAVMSGRRMTPEQLEAVANGRVYPAEQAKALGLVDAIQSFEQCLADLEAGKYGGMMRGNSGGRRSVAEGDIPAQTRAQNEESIMSESTTTPAGSSGAGQEPRPATIAELRAAYPDDPAFALDAAEKAYTLVEAEAAYAKVLRTRLAEEKAKPAPVAPPAPGVKPLSEGSAPQSQPQTDAVAEFGALVREQMRAHGGTLRDASVAVARANPDLHRAYLMATNPGRKARQSIEEKFGAN